MIPLSLQTLADVVEAELVLPPTLISADYQIKAVTTDTRSVTEGCLFIALQGKRFDAHDFVTEAVAAGAKVLLVSKGLSVAAAQLVVKDTRLALGELAGWVRRQAPARVIALTGSAGKTSVKEMAAAILRQCGKVLYTAGNFNNDIGVPLTLLHLTPQHDFAVIELGANHSGEIAFTAGLSRPETALVNNLSPAHLEGFGTLAGVAQAKGEIFASLPANGIAIINADSHDWPHWQANIGKRKVWCFSTQMTKGVDFFASDIKVDQHATQFTLHAPIGSVAIALPLLGRHNVANALAAAALAMSVGANLAAVRQGLSQLQALPGRLFPIRLAEGKLLLDDSYNANVGSMISAAQTLAQMPGYRVMVVGDMAELGGAAEDYHRQVGESARWVDKVLSVGSLSQVLSRASGNGEHFQDKAALIARLVVLLSEHKVITILVKGSRSAAMENVVNTLQERSQC